MRYLALAFILSVIASLDVARAQSCQYDDGSVEDSLGLTVAGSECWMHKFGAIGSPTTVSSLLVAWGNPNFPGQAPANGTPASVAVWADPNNDGNPSDAVLVALQSTTVQNVDTGILNVIALPSPVTLSGVFFIGAEVVHTTMQFPAPLDTSVASLGRAWITGNAGSSFNFNNLMSNTIPPQELDSLGSPGVFLLRLDCSVHAGADFFTTPGGTCTYQDFSATPLPAGFFSPSGCTGTCSLPFAGSVFFIGSPLTGTNLPPNADTIVKRLADATLSNCPANATVPIEIVALSLISYQPIEVSFPGGVLGHYNVSASVSSTQAQTQGSMVIHKTHANGGTFDSSLPVTPRMVFTRVDGPGLASIVLDPAPVVTLTAPAPGVGFTSPSWVYNDMGLGIPTSPGGLVDHDVNSATAQVPYPPSSNFFGGVTQEGADCMTAGSLPKRELTGEAAVNARHCIFPITLAGDGPFCFCEAPNPNVCNPHNYGNPGHGCANSSNPNGGLLEVSGNALLNNDDLLLHASGVPPTALCIFLQGTTPVIGLFGDGLRCTGGVLKRIYVHNASAGVVVAPVGSDLSVHLRSAQLGRTILPGDLRLYQVYYRDSSLVFCPPAAFNITSAYALTWQ